MVIPAVTLAVWAASKKAVSAAWSLRPGSASTPLATSTAYGWATAIASATFSGRRPPATIAGTSERRSRSSSQSKLSPVPPQSPPRRLSKRWKSVRKASAAWTSAALATWTALITLTPVCRATSAQNEGPSSPFSCTIVKPRVLDGLRDLVQLGIDEHADDLALPAKRRSDLRTASAASTARGLSAKWISPIAQAPRRTASAASSRLVIPQILTRMHPEYGRAASELATRHAGR